MRDPRADLARDGTDAIRLGFETYLAERSRITRRARSRFEARDWEGAQRDARERLDLRDRLVHETVGRVRAELGAAVHDRATWVRMKERYEQVTEDRPDREIGQSFFNSVTRRVFATVGVDPTIEFLAQDVAPPREGPIPLYRTFPRRASTELLLRDLLDAYAFQVPYDGLDEDVRLAAIELDAHLRTLEDRQPIERVEMAKEVFFRGKGAYLVGRLRRGAHTTPLVLALVHGERGVSLDAILFTPEDVSIVFSFTRSYFHVEVDRPRELVAFLSTLIPQKRVSELYIALGFDKHGKTEMYREIAGHLGRTGDRFVPARGDRGLVMSVFTLRGLDVVFKIIRDRFAPPKQTTRQEVMSKYRRVFRHDRAGRLVDAQEFEHLLFPRERFAPEVLEELTTACGETVEVRGDDVAIRHLYAERRVTPLNLFIREVDEWTARQAVRDFGQAIRDLAATNTFPGDLLLKNWGVTRHGRVIFYDYDEITSVTDCVFRDLPSARGDEEELSAEPWFYVGENDVFPEELLPFLGLPPRLRDAFVQEHGELLTPRWWRGIQERVRAGETVDVYPYLESQRLLHARER
ncbi:MAG TPA: bifunctional isocitrate dehydrogenase kinase/phosphatase [Anaeromyxobacteraceae bacterium]|nr:bifunctional isocitrate dehydrogenase kinase/phosphatase [Anaeromyxobacteraceae bacterium]